jgi:hypothetical protein
MTLNIHPSTSTREPPTLATLEQTDDTWQLDLTPYRTFIADVTGVELTDSPSHRDLKTVQSRLEGCVESYARDGNCKCRDLGQYEQIESYTTVRELAQFFRVAVEAERPVEEPAT